MGLRQRSKSLVCEIRVTFEFRIATKCTVALYFRSLLNECIYFQSGRMFL